MAINSALVVVPGGNVWTPLNSSDAATIQFQNTGSASADISRSDGTAPADAAAFYRCHVDDGTPPAAIDDVIMAPVGGIVWARSQTGTQFSVGWS
ncbi:MAG: hypothetical protein ACJA1L_000009 [Paracoccaceae bacterium]|jgi:hypothetical protein